MTWITRSKKLALIGIIGLMAAIVPGSPASATANADVVSVTVDGAAGIAECAAVGVTTNGRSMELVVRGTATIAGATNVSLVCHVWQNTPSYKHGHAGGVGTAGAAVAAGVVRNFNLAQYNICAEVFIVTLTGSAHLTCIGH